ncbi:MAG TPA: hypothetical protein VGR54_08990 [Nitrosopumilaceae archaeon]|nr:hypothetical protein [Nitrosopumilaceae archaeon]
MAFCFTIFTAYGDTGNGTRDQLIEDTKSLVQATWILASGTCVVGISTIISVILYTRDRDKQNQTTLILDVFKLLNDDEHRNARKLTYEAYRKFKTSNDITIFDDESHYRFISMTASDFDHVGSLIKNSTSIKKVFFDIYADTVIICWKALEEHIKAERNKRKANFYMKFFEWLANEAITYWHQNRQNEPIPEPY